MDTNHTIAAISTPLGTGGIGIVRLSGPQALVIAQQIFRSYSGTPLSALTGYMGMLGRIFDRDGDIDEAIAFVYLAPKSYTGEDVVELSCHGGSWLVQRVLRLCFEAGAVPAAAGEFTKRAYLNGKMDLLQAEAVSHLITAQGDGALRVAIAAKDGALSTAIESVVETLLSQSAHLAAWADYPEEDLIEVDTAQLLAVLEQAAVQMQALLATWDRGKILREGIRTAIVGRPNVGKSTLMNLLAGQGKSIVTDVPGTTRDIVEDHVRLGGCVLQLADTAGIRNTNDPVESIGVDRAKERIETADLILAVFDSSDALTQDDIQLLDLLQDRPCIAVINKMDLSPRLDQQRIAQSVSRIVSISAATGQGRDQLEEEVVELLELQQMDPSTAMVYSERQRWSLRQALQAIEEAVDMLQAGMTLDAINVSIDFALSALFSLTGRNVTENVIDTVFAQFCVGK